MLAIIEPQTDQTLTVNAGATSFTIAAAIFSLMDVRAGDRLWSGSSCMIVRSIDPDSGHGTLLQGWPGANVSASPDWYIEQSPGARLDFAAVNEQVSSANAWLARVLGQGTAWAVQDIVSAPPSGAANGQTYLASATAAAGFQPNLLYRRQAGTWVPIQPRTGDMAFVVTSRETMGWDGSSWGAAAPPAGSVPTVSLAEGAVTGPKLADAAVSNAKLADMTAGTIKLRALGAGSGPPVDGTAAQARAIVQVIDPTPNLFVNGAMQHSQENGDNAGTVTGSSAWYHAADEMFIAATGSGFAVSAQRVASMTLAGSRYRVRVSVTTAKASLAINDICFLQQRIEGGRLAGLRFGAAAARRLVGSFMFRGPAGTYGYSFSNTAGTRVWVGNFTVTPAQANTDTFQTISIDPETSGAWVLSNAAGAYFSITFGSGSDQFGSLGWNNTWRSTTSAQMNGLGSIGNIFEVGDFDLYPDISGIGAVRPFVIPESAEELLRCQRYYEKSYSPNVRPGSNVGSDSGRISALSGLWGGTQMICAGSAFTVNKRVTPTVTYYDNAGNAGCMSWRPVSDGNWYNNHAIQWPSASETWWKHVTSVSQSAFASFDWVANARM